VSAQEPRPVDGAAPPDGVARVKKAPPRKKGKADAEAVAARGLVVVWGPRPKWPWEECALERAPAGWM
jgi:hypothetical protein